MKNKKNLVIGFGVIAVIALTFGMKYLLDLKDYKQAMASVAIESVDIAELKNGVYFGSYDAKVIAASVEVRVDDGKIVNIDLVKHKYDKGGPAIAVIDEIIENQSLEVDMVSGATNSSKTILKAVENAIGSEPIQK